MRILLIDDDERLQANMRDFLEPYGCEIHTLSNGLEALPSINELKPDLILLDVMLPGEDGFNILQKIRLNSRIPVIMLTARGDDTDRIVGLEMGADDYLPKPFNPRELLARIKAVLRRSATEDSGIGQPENGLLSVGEITLDVKRQKLKHNAESIMLSTTEFRIIYAFMQKAGVVLSRDDLLTLAFGKDYYANDRNIDVYISRIRSTLKKINADPTIIQTVWGAGYCWIKDGE